MPSLEQIEAKLSELYIVHEAVIAGGFKSADVARNLKVLFQIQDMIRQRKDEQLNTKD